MRTFALALVGLLAGCSTDPDEVLPVYGTLVSSGAVEGQTVQLLRRIHRRSAQAAFEMCDSSLAVPFQETEADSSGAYRFEPLRAEAAGFTTGTSICFRVQATFPSGSTAWSDFSFGKDGERSLAPLREWRSGLALDGGVLSFEPVVPLPDLNPPMFELDGGPHFEPQLFHRATVMTADGGVIWQVDDRIVIAGPVRREPMVVDAIRLEDFSGSVQLRASYFDPRERTLAFVYEVAQPPVEIVAAERLPVSGSLVPLSRGLPCPEVAVPCPLTDGKLVVEDLSSVDRVTFELTPPSEVAWVVLRGLAMRGPAIEVSLIQEDGGLNRRNTTIDRSLWPEPWWAELVPLANGDVGAPAKGFMALSFDAGVPVQRVIVRFPDGVLRASELSIFAP